MKRPPYEFRGQFFFAVKGYDDDLQHYFRNYFAVPKTNKSQGLPRIEIHALLNSADEHTIAIPDELLPYFFTGRVAVEAVVQKPDVFISKGAPVAGKSGRLENPIVATGKVVIQNISAGWHIKNAGFKVGVPIY
jgi:hypothetical protein